MRPWVGFDLDGTLAHYETGNYRGNHIGAPIAETVKRLLTIRLLGAYDVKVMTARVGIGEHPEFRAVFGAWATEHLGFVPELTCTKDFGMVALYDDRAIAVGLNTGVIHGVGGSIGEELAR